MAVLVVLVAAAFYWQVASIGFLVVPILGLLGWRAVKAEDRAAERDELFKRHHLDKRAELVAQATIEQARTMARHDQRLDKIITGAQAKALGQQIINQNTYNITASGHGTVTTNVVSGDFLNHSIQELKKDDPKLEDALETIAGYIESHGTEASKAIFNDFNKNVSEKSSSGTLRALWREIVDLLPDAIKVTDAAVTIGKHFGL
ncbi:hypothetical protein [Bradyrhizobium sp. AZCC 2262]|uniref:hypothetical protein n=1 Tax=Bradyrhizobium sp. AZCC 2262 TaxID=3117022 RepID=UPI002FEECEF5